MWANAVEQNINYDDYIPLIRRFESRNRCKIIRTFYLKQEQFVFEQRHSNKTR